jgi:predicted phosphodiesterase
MQIFMLLFYSIAVLFSRGVMSQMSREQRAVIADIHGNRWALEAVLRDIRRRGITRIINLGDSLYGPLDPAATAEMLIELDPVSVQGNEDRIIFEPSAEPGPTLEQVRAGLSADQVMWLRRQPLTAELDGELLLCHGSPARDTEYLLWEVRESGAQLRTTAAVAGMIPAGSHRLVLCGHDHLPRILAIPGGPTVVNPGSVGLPAYADDQPFAHVMETGSPHARYAVISAAGADWLVDQVAVPYDWQAAAATAASNGRPDWEQWLRTGRAS